VPRSLSDILTSTKIDVDVNKKQSQSSFEQTNEQISLKVSETDYNGNTIASLINQTATTIDIQASKINLVGAVTVLSDITGNLGTITAGTITGTTFKTSNNTNNVSIANDQILSVSGTSYSTFIAAGRIQAENHINNRMIEIYGDAIYFNDNSGTTGVGNIKTTVQQVTLEAYTTLSLKAPTIRLDGATTLNGHLNTAYNLYPSSVYATNNVQGSSASFSGSVTANNYVTTSRRDLKEDINDFLQSALDKVNSTKVKKYRFKDKKKERLDIGLIYEDAPIEIQSENEKGINLYAMTSLLWKGSSRIKFGS